MHMIRNLRNLQRIKCVRDFVSESHIKSSDFIYPIFVGEESTSYSRSSSKNAFEVFSVFDISKILDRLQEIGIGIVALFEVCSKHLKDEFGSFAYNEKNQIYNAIRYNIRIQSIGVMSDISLDPYTTHGHDGILKNDYVDNDETIKICQ